MFFSIFKNKIIMKKYLIALFITIPCLVQASTSVTFTKQSEIDTYTFITGEDYSIDLLNDTTLPVSEQISSLLPLMSINGSISLSIEHTLITSLDGLQNAYGISFYLEGNKNWDTLFIPDFVEILYGFTCERTFLKKIYGAEKVKLLNVVNIVDNDRLKEVDLDLRLNDSVSVPTGQKLTVKFNDSLQTFYWGSLEKLLARFSFYDNRQLKHVHLETVMELVTAIYKPEGGFVFNPELDSISGFKGLNRSRMGYINSNYKLKQACVLQQAIQNEIDATPGIDTVFQVFNNAAELSSLNDLLTMDCSWLPNGVHEPEWSKLELYPNPANNEVYVGVQEQTTSYIIYDISGKTISQGLVESSGRISLETISNGMYVLMVGNKRSKLIVQ
jgi:hypothetical protein